ncbi:LysR family transcriptional regulator [Parapusillimonas sp. JC17]|uniref:LysR family transcriptional regulator n=1 Tax=Parapusillimonas sp. JC17 TaxID=3445768 RepID=UPI003F9F8BA4
MPINNPRRRITIRELDVFAAVADGLSFSKASEQLNISQPSLSATVRNLEETLGTRLFDRHTRSVALTPVGHELALIAKQLLTDFDHAFDRMSDIIDGKVGTLTIAASPSVMSGFLPGALKEFRKAHPRIEVQLHEEVFEQCIGMLRAEKVEVALTPRKADAEDLLQYALFEDRLILVCRNDHPLAQFDSVQWRQIMRYEQIALKAASNVRQLIEQEYQRHGIQAKILYEVERVSSMISFISQGHGVGILPYSLFHAYDRSKVTYRVISDGELSRMICASCLKTQSPSPIAEAFIRLCVQHGEGSDPIRGLTPE